MSLAVGLDVEDMGDGAQGGAVLGEKADEYLELVPNDDDVRVVWLEAKYSRCCELVHQAYECFDRQTERLKWRAALCKICMDYMRVGSLGGILLDFLPYTLQHPISLNVPGQHLQLVVEYIHHHKHNVPQYPKPLRSTTDMKLNVVDPWDSDFANGIVDQLGMQTLIELIETANYLHISPLLQLLMMRAAFAISSKPLDQIKNILKPPQPPQPQPQPQPFVNPQEW